MIGRALVEPSAPIRPRPPIQAAGRKDLTDIAVLEALPDDLIGGAEDDVRRRQQIPPARARQLHQGGGFIQADGHGLFDQHVLAGLEGCARDWPMLWHGRQHEHQVDVGGVDDLFVSLGHAANAVFLLRGQGAAGKCVADGNQLDLPLARHGLGLGEIGPADAAAADHAEAHSRLLAIAGH
jgi:hypothetical protein